MNVSRFLQPLFEKYLEEMNGKSIEFELSYSYSSYTLNFLVKLTTIIFGYSLADLQRKMNIIMSIIWNFVWIIIISIFKVSFVVENVKSKKAEMNQDTYMIPHDNKEKNVDYEQTSILIYY